LTSKIYFFLKWYGQEQRFKADLKKIIRVWVPKLQGENEEGGGKNFVNSKTKL
jgi:hypothetical protein